MTRSWSGAANSAARRWCRAASDGRDHHPNAFTMWMAGGGIKRGVVIGETDELGFNVAKDKVHVHDLHATMSAPARIRPHEADLQVPGTAVPLDRRAWECGEGIVGVTLTVLV